MLFSGTVALAGPGVTTEPAQSFRGARNSPHPQRIYEEGGATLLGITLNFEIKHKKSASFDALLQASRRFLWLDSLIVEVLRVVGLGEEEPAFEQQAEVLDEKGHDQQALAAVHSGPQQE